MKNEPFQFLAAVIAAHPQRRLLGRTRLQKTVYLLQRLGLPSDYYYTLHFYGPYSEAVFSDSKMLGEFRLVSEHQEETYYEGNPRYLMQASDTVSVEPVKAFQPVIDKLATTDPVIFELAATYDSFRQMGYDHSRTLTLLREKKGSKCANGNEQKALLLLSDIGLPSS